MTSKSVGFLLRYVNWKDILERYLSGEFNRLGAISKTALNVNTINFQASNLTSSHYEKRYALNTRDGTEMILHTTNCRIFDDEDDGTIQCGYCGISLPVKRKENTPVIEKLNFYDLLVVNEGKPSKKIQIDIYAEEFCCNYHCALSLATRDYPPGVSENIRFVHRMQYPDCPKLERSAPYKLLDIHGGSMNYKEYTARGNDCYIPTIGMTLCHFKRSIAII